MIETVTCVPVFAVKALASASAPALSLPTEAKVTVPPPELPASHAGAAGVFEQAVEGFAGAGLAGGQAAEHDQVSEREPARRRDRREAEVRAVAVQQRRDQGGGVHPEVGQDAGDRQRVGDVGLTGGAEHAVVGGGGQLDGGIDAGQVVCLVGVAPVKPAEFVIFRLSQFSGGTSLVSE